jgi:hypothetical protein
MLSLSFQQEPGKESGDENNKEYQTKMRKLHE